MRLDEAQHTTDAPEPETPADLFIHSGRRLCCHGDVGHGATSDLKKKKKSFVANVTSFILNVILSLKTFSSSPDLSD